MVSSSPSVRAGNPLRTNHRWRRLSPFTAACVALGLLLVAAPAAGALVIVEEGEARAVVVTAAEPSAVARYAAEELVHHVEKASGATLPIVSEADDETEHSVRIYVGATEAASQQGLDAEALGPDEFIMRITGGAIYLLGKEDADADPLDEANPHSGTLFGVYEFLHREVGVRWLWPGALGTYVPEHETLAIEPKDEVIPPKLAFRRFRWRQIERTMGRDSTDPLSFTTSDLQEYGRDLQVHLRRHRMGYSQPKPRVGHYFGSWWGSYGEDHPEWFAMDEDGQRGYGQPPSSRVVPMCVSNPELHRYIVEEAWDGGDELRLGEVDSGRYCHCETCLSWDGPQPDDARSRVISDRYARFWKTIHEKAARRNPDVLVTTFLYVDYFPAPQTDIELNENIYGEYVPWGYNAVWFPTDRERVAWAEEQWLGWSEAGITIGYRPNHTLAGYAMPHINTHQAGEFFRFAYEHGMLGVDFDSLTGQWAVRGPQHYMYMRLATDPELTIDGIRAEFFSAFGPAAEHVERYFDYWEDHTRQLQETGQWANMYNNPSAAPDQYPADVFPPAEDLLDQALEAAMDHPREEYAERVRFLAAGLEHARMSAELVAHYRVDLPVYDPDRLERAHELFERVKAFRADPDNRYVADYQRLARLERRRFDEQIEQLSNIDAARELFEADLGGLDIEPPTPVESGAPFSFEHASVRGRANFVIYASEGAEVVVEMDHRPVSRRPRPAPPVRIVVSDAEGNVVHRAELSYNEETQIAFNAPTSGFYRLTGSPAGHRVTLLRSTHPVNIYTGEMPLHVRRGAGDYYFWVPAGTEEFAVSIAGRGTIERVQGELFNPAGERVAHEDNVTDEGAELRFRYGPDEAPDAGEVWRVRIDRPSEHRYFDQFIDLDGVPPLLAPTPDSVLRSLEGQ